MPVSVLIGTGSRATPGCSKPERSLVGKRQAIYSYLCNVKSTNGENYIARMLAAPRPPMHGINKRSWSPYNWSADLGLILTWIIVFFQRKRFSDCLRRNY
ncbi:hypothetical protein AB1N83_012705 [Pleurotus pulmonarius]